MNTHFKKNSGFTLIETLLYTALLGIIMSGSLIVTYEIISGNEVLSVKVAAEEEANYIIRKIDWALIGSTKDNTSVPNTRILNTVNGSFVYDTATETLSLDTVNLNTINAPLSGLTFSELPGSVGITATFEIDELIFTKIKYFNL